MWHYLVFMILAWTQKSKKDLRAVVQEWETEQGASSLPVSGLHLICLLLQCLLSPKGDFFSFPSLPDGNWFTCLLNHLLQEPLSLFSDSAAHQEQWPAIPGLRFPGEIPPTTSKGPAKSKRKNRSTICRLKSAAVGSTLPLDAFLQGVYRSRIKGWEILTQMWASLSQSFGIPSSALWSSVDLTD